MKFKREWLLGGDRKHGPEDEVWGYHSENGILIRVMTYGTTPYYEITLNGKTQIFQYLRDAKRFCENAR